MSPLNDIHQDFAAAIWGQAAPPPDLVPSHRLSIYRNNVLASLIGVLRARYPVICRLLGEECFSACAWRFIVAAPPASPVLLEYGGAFPAFLGAQVELQSLGYLTDVADLEWARHIALQAANAEHLDAAALAVLAPEQLPDLIFTPHPSTRFLQSVYPIGTIWRANRFDEETRHIAADAAGEDVLITRRDDLVAMTIVPPGQSACVAAVLTGQTVGAAAALTIDLSAALAVLFRSGALSGFHN